MLRVEAAEILKEILLTCGNIEGKSIKLMPHDADSVLSNGYQIHIQKARCDAENVCIRRIAKKYDLALHVEDNFMVLYKPAESTVVV